jgi:purine-binding chemotaxis protein CheW
VGADGDDLHSVVVFRLGGEHFGVPVPVVREVVPYAWLAQPPRMPNFVEGVLNLGGVAVPVMRLDDLLGMPRGKLGLDASILIMKRPGAPMGLLVEHVDGVRPAAAFQMLPVEDRNSFQGCLVGELHGAGDDVHLISWEKVLMEEERRRLEQFQQSAQDRLAELADSET